MRTLPSLAMLSILITSTFTLSQGTAPEIPRIIPARIDLNSASKQQLTTLEGVDGQIADQIIAGRPYNSADELKERKILADAVYDKVKSKIGIGPSKGIRRLTDDHLNKIAVE
jgi:hypothetical protein